MADSAFQNSYAQKPIFAAEEGRQDHRRPKKSGMPTLAGIGKGTASGGRGKNKELTPMQIAALLKATTVMKARPR